MHAQGPGGGHENDGAVTRSNTTAHENHRERGDENPVKCPPVSVASRHVPTHQRALLSYVTEVSEVSVAPRHVPTHHRVRSLRTRRCAAGRCDGYGATVRSALGFLADAARYLAKRGVLTVTSPLRSALDFHSPP